MINKLRLIIVALLILVKGLLFLSCSSSYNAFQVMETNSNDVAFKDGIYSYENNDLKLTYNFWEVKGCMKFYVFNKSSNAIYIDFNKSHLILNGYSSDYYEDLEKISTISSGKKVSSYNSYGLFSTSSLENQSSIRFRQKPIVQIPPQSFITFTHKIYLDYSFDNCEVANIKRGAPYIINYEQKNSPIAFRNYITYSKEINMSNLEVIDNNFWMSKVMIVTAYDFKSPKNVEKYNCQGVKQTGRVYYFPYESPKNIYYEFKHNSSLLTDKDNTNAKTRK